MTISKLAIIGGSGLYDVEEFKNRELLDLDTPWGKPSDKILKTNYNNREVYFLPRHGKGHFISPSKINAATLPSDISISFAAASAVPPVAIKSSIIKTLSFL